MPVVLITQNKEDVPFDFRHIRFIVYDTKKTRWEQTLRENLKGALSAMINDRSDLPVLPWPNRAALGIESGLDIRNTRYGFSDILDDKCVHVLMTGSNFGDLLGTRDNRQSVLYDRIIRLLTDNARVVFDIVFAPPRLLGSETEFGYKDLVEMSLPRMWDLAHDPRLTDDQRNRVRIKTHRGHFSCRPSCATRMTHNEP